MNARDALMDIYIYIAVCCFYSSKVAKSRAEKIRKHKMPKNTLSRTLAMGKYLLEFIEFFLSALLSIFFQSFKALA